MRDILELIDVLKQKNRQKIDREKNGNLRWLLTIIIENDNILKNILEDINE